MEISGKVVRVLDIRSGKSKTSGNFWVSQEYILETSEARPRQICFEIFGEDRIKAMDVKEGEYLVVSVEVESREYQNHWFTQVRAWKVERMGQIGHTVPPVITAQATPIAVMPPMSDAITFPEGEDYGLPF